MGKIANIVGATGLVGKELTQQLLENPSFSRVNIFVRRPSGIKHPKLQEYIVDFSTPGQWVQLVEGDVLFSALGTTLKQAGSKEKEYEVDFIYNLNFAKAALKNNIPAYVLVSSVGANPKSRIFYTRMKGELEAEVTKLGFNKLVILRPSVLVGKRSEKRPMEQLGITLGNFFTRFIFKKYKPIKGETVARAMVQSVGHKTEKKTRVYELDELFSLANA